MSDRCRYVASDQARVLPGRHVEDCGGDCDGCQPCPMDHCRVCGIEHSVGACGGCLAEVRESLGAVVELCGGLPAETEHKGINTEAMSLLGPTADPEAWGHVQASVRSGRLPAEWQETANDERHPLFVLGTWEMVYRDAFDHPTAELVTIVSAAAYLGEHLTEAANEEWVPFEDMARDLRQCRSHLESVLHDGEQIERTRVTCTSDTCQRRPMLERKYGYGDEKDRWACPSCRKVYEPGEYRDAMARQLVHKGAEKYLPLRDAVSTLVAQGRPERTIRKWLEPPERGDLDAVVGGFCEVGSHRVWVWWPDLWRLHMTTKTRRRVAA